MEHKKNGLIAICLAISIGVLTGCGTKENLNINQQMNSSVQIQQADSIGSSETLEQTTTINKTVAISNACIGCGKCARMVSNTFAMDGRKATVISQKYASSSAVQQAANHCPVSAISVS